MYPRYVKKRLVEALQDTPVVAINGPRQCGKSTLAKQFIDDDRIYYTLDDQATLNAALEDPAGFVRTLPNKVIIDEIQRAPELFLSIKKRVDDNRQAGQFLLTGSANILVLPQIADSLAGRIEIIPLLPLAEVEIRRKTGNFVDEAWSGRFTTPSRALDWDEVLHRIVTGGFPEPLQRENVRRMRAWQQQYITTTIQRDIKELSDIDRLEQIPDLLTALTNQTAQLLNMAGIANSLRIPRNTADRYTTLLSHIFLIEELQPWFSNRNKRLIKTPKVHLLDTGIACRSLNATPDALKSDRELLGHLLETFVFCELKKQASWAERDVKFFFYRDKDQYEVDLILESDGQFLAVEIKAAATVRKSDFAGIERFARQVETHFVGGIVLYDGDHALPFGEKLTAVPIGCLWN